MNESTETRPSENVISVKEAFFTRQLTRSAVAAGASDAVSDRLPQLLSSNPAAGREVVLQKHAGMPHDFMVFPGIDESDTAMAGVYAFAKQALKG